MRNIRSIICNIILIVLAILLSSCSAGKLTEEECLSIQQKEIAQISSWSGAARDPRWVNEKIRRNVASCVAGERYTREDYKCFVSAATNEEIGRCMCIEYASTDSDKEWCNDQSNP